MTNVKMPLLDGFAVEGEKSNKGTGNAVKHGERIAALGACKQRSRQMAKHLKNFGTTQQHEKLHSQVAGCANYLVFHHYYTRDEIRLAKARTCKKHLLCPFCARARGAKLMEKNIQRVAQALENNPALVPAMLTLTVKNGQDLEERMEHLLQSFRTLQKRRRQWNDVKRGFTEFAKIDGAIYATEVTNKGNGWHPHIHAVVLLDSYIDQKALSEEWQRITGDSSVVDIRKIKKDTQGEVTDALAEVFKYAVKFAELPLDLNLEAYDVLNGKRLVGGFGSLHGLKLPDKLTDELLDDLPYLEMFYKFLPHKGAFELVDVEKRDNAQSKIDVKSQYHSVCHETGEITRTARLARRAFAPELPDRAILGGTT